MQEGEGKIQKAQEYLLEKPLTNADKKYTNANDHNVFIQTIENDTNYSVDEYTLDGKFVRHIFTNNFHCAKPWMLYYANNQELIFGDGEQAYTVPLVLKNGNSFHSRKRQRKYVMRIFRCMRAICMRMKIILCTTRFQIVTVYTIAKTKSLLRKKEFRNEMCIYSVVWGTALYLTARLTEKKENSCMTGGGMSESVSQIGQRIRRLKLEMKREIR